MDGGVEEDFDIERFTSDLRSDIRNGLFAVIAALVLLLGGTGAAYFYIRRKRANAGRLTFNDEVGKMLEEQAQAVEEVEGEPGTVNDTVAEFREIQRQIMEERRLEEEDRLEPSPPMRMTVGQAEAESESADVGRGEERPAASGSSAHFLADTNDRKPITEEVKSLVSKMFREGHSTEDICRASDLTRTEVELIIAVREREVEHMVANAVEDMSGDNPVELDTDHLYAAIAELSADGHAPREVARRLGISTSEINFALAVMRSENNKS